MNYIFTITLTLLLVACSQSDDGKPQQAGQVLNPVKTAAHLAAIEVAATAGNQAFVEAHGNALQEDIRKSLKLADPARRIDSEAARGVTKGVAGVHSVAWMDRDNLLVIVDDLSFRNERTIDTICWKLEPLGDTLGVIVNLKARNPHTYDERRRVSRNCQLAVGQRAMFQKEHQEYDPPPEVLAAFRASQHSKTRNESVEEAEARRILEASTPEM